MPRYSWEGRTKTGSVARGEIDAPNKDVALQKIKSAGVMATRVDAVSDEDEGPSVPVGSEFPPQPPPARTRPGESLRDKLFYIGVAAVFTILAIGTAYVAPVLVYDCARDANGAVNCTVHRRMYGLFPLSDLTFPNLLSVEMVTGEDQAAMKDSWRRPTAYSALVLVCANGTRWRSYDSTWPIGRTNSELRNGIGDLLEAKAPMAYRGWKGEKVPLLVAGAFLLPAGLMLLALLVKLMVSRAAIEAKVAGLEAEVDRRAKNRRQAALMGRRSCEMKSLSWAFLTFGLLAFGSTVAEAEVAESSASGFVVKFAVSVAAPREKAYDALLQIGRWWDPEHTYSGDSANLSIDPRPGGCFCEKLPGGGVQHMTVVMLAPGKLLRLTGGLGPLQEAGVSGSLTFALAAHENATDLTVTYVVGGYRQGGFVELAPIVDFVLGSQVARFKRLIDTGQPAAVAK